MQLGELRAVARFPVYLGVAQLVACYLGVVEAAGSSPVTQTRKNPRSFEAFSKLRGFLFFAKSSDEKLTKKVHNKNRHIGCHWTNGFFLPVFVSACGQKYTLHSDFIHKVAPIRSAFHTSFYIYFCRILQFFWQDCKFVSKLVRLHTSFSRKSL